MCFDTLETPAIVFHNALQRSMILLDIDVNLFFINILQIDA